MVYIRHTNSYLLSVMLNYSILLHHKELVNCYLLLIIPCYSLCSPKIDNFFDNFFHPLKAKPRPLSVDPPQAAALYSACAQGRQGSGINPGTPPRKEKEKNPPGFFQIIIPCVNIIPALRVPPVPSVPEWGLILTPPFRHLPPKAKTRKPSATQRYQLTS